MKINFDDFDRFYPERMKEEVFESLLPSASAYVDVITANRAQNATGYKAERVKMAICAVINEMAAHMATRSESGARISSVSNDGYTENYGAQTAATEESALRSVVFRYLSGTGLVSAL